MTYTITVGDMMRVAGRDQATDVMNAVVGPLNVQLAAAGILRSRLQLCHAMAQWCVETAWFRTLVEDGSKTYFAKYDGREDLGNTQKGDGYRFRGRGLTMLTGRANYAEAAGDVGLDLVGNPDLAADPQNAVTIAVHYWTSRKAGAAAEADDARRVTKLINGGLNGFDDRLSALTRAKLIWPDPISLTMPVEARAIDRSTKALQRALNRLGADPWLTPDGSYGPLTAESVRKFQAAHGLVTDGRAGPATWKAIEDAIAELDAG